MNTRDDIADGGATHIAATVAALKATKPSLMVEVSGQFKKTLSSLAFVSLWSILIRSHTLITSL